MTDSTSDRLIEIDAPTGDTFPCPCCGELLPNMFIVESSDLDDEQWTERVAACAELLRKTDTELTEQQVNIYSAMIVSVSIYKESIPQRVRDVVEKEWEQLPLPISYVYFIQRVGGGPIKIGRSINPEKRLRALQTAEAVILLATMPGGMQTESALHKKFAPARVHGEWFEPTPELMELIKKVKDNT